MARRTQTQAWSDDSPEQIAASLEREGHDSEIVAALNAYIAGAGPERINKRGRRRMTHGVRTGNRKVGTMPVRLERPSRKGRDGLGRRI